MKKIESGNFTYTQKEIMIGNKKRSVILIEKKPTAKLGKNKITNNSLKTVSIEKKGCSGCSRRRRG